MPASITTTGFWALVQRLSLSNISDRFLQSAILPWCMDELCVRCQREFITRLKQADWCKYYQWYYLQPPQLAGANNRSKARPEHPKEPLPMCTMLQVTK